MDKDVLFEKFTDIMKKEQYFAHGNWEYVINNPQEIYGITKQLLEVTRSGMVLRSYIDRYHLSSNKVAYMSIGGHTNLMTTIVDRALTFECHEYETELVYGFSYRTIMEAARRHDLPENLIGDIPDDGNCDTVAKAKQENEYWQNYSSFSPGGEEHNEMHINEILKRMNEHNSYNTKVGTLLYLADKLSAILEVLTYDFCGYSPRKHINEEVSRNDREAMNLCDFFENSFRRASEMWTITFLKQRCLPKMDSFGFFTAVLVMATLIINETWYDWREKDYNVIT